MDEFALIDYMTASWPEYCKDKDVKEHVKPLRKCGSLLLALQSLNECNLLETVWKEFAIQSVLSGLHRFVHYFEQVN